MIFFLLSKGFVPPASVSRHQPPMDPSAKSHSPLRVTCDTIRNAYQSVRVGAGGCIFWHGFLPPQRVDVLIRQASVFLINDVQFVLQLRRPHWKTFEENV